MTTVNKTDEKTFQVRIENGEFWGDETDGIRTIIVFPTLLDAVIASNLFCEEALAAELKYTEDEIEVVTFINNREVNVSTVEDIKINDYEKVLAFTSDTYDLALLSKSKIFSGKILGMTDLHLAQNCGRKSVIHEIPRLNAKATVGDMVDICYSGGSGTVIKKEITLER